MFPRPLASTRSLDQLYPSAYPKLMPALLILSQPYSQATLGRCPNRDFGRPVPVGIGALAIFLDTMSGRTILVTGLAGFIGFHIARKLLAEGREAIIKGRPTGLFNHGNIRWDFSYID